MAKISMVVGKYSFLDTIRARPADLADIDIAFDDSYTPTHTAFGSMASEQKFDVSELAIATYVQARAVRQPLTLLPVTLLGRFQHEQLQVRHDSALTEPSDLAGRRIAVRAYSQTTGLWVRAFLRRQYGVDIGNIEWVVFEEPHVRNLQMPPNVVAAPAETSMLEMLRDGSVDAVIGATGGLAEGIRPLLDRPGDGAREWYESTGVVPVNHVLTAAERVVHEQPDAVRRIYRHVRDAVRDFSGGASQSMGPVDPQWKWATRVDVMPTDGDLLAVLDVVAEETYEQGLIPEPLGRDSTTNPTVLGWMS